MPDPPDKAKSRDQNNECSGNPAGERVKTPISNRLRATANRVTVDTFHLIDRTGITPDIGTFEKFSTIGIDRTDGRILGMDLKIRSSSGLWRRAGAELS
jgi:hypothetical protein